MLARVFVIATFVLAVSAVGAASKPEEVTIQQLLTAPQRFHGKLVTVTGFFECAGEAGCELRVSRAPQDRIHTIFLDFSQEQQVAIDNTHPSHGRLRVVGRFEYSRPFPDIVHPTPSPTKPVRDGQVERRVVTVWNGFYSTLAKSQL
jgi:hypothetical protein